jgi:hypothetical protein
MKKYFLLTLVIPVFLGIVLPLALGVKDLTYMAIFFSSVWAIYSLILFGYVFLVEGRRNRNRLNDVDPFPPELIREWEALWEITVERHKDPGMGNHDWN